MFRLLLQSNTYIFSMMNRYTTSLVCSLLCFASVQAQDNITAMEQWRNIPSYYGATALVEDGNKLWVGTTYGAFSYDIIDKEYTHYSKVTGMSESEIRTMAIDPKTGLIVIGYESANIDILRDNKFENIPDIKISTLLGDKRINHMTAYDAKAYVSTPLGLIVADLLKRQINTTIVFYEGTTKAVNLASAIVGNDIYAATSVGLFKTALNNNLMQNYASWTKISSSVYESVVHTGDHIYLLRNTPAQDTVYKLNPDNTVTYQYHDENLVMLRPQSQGRLWIAKGYQDGPGYCKLVDASMNVITQCIAFTPTGVTLHDDGQLYYTDNDKTSRHGGLKRKITTNEFENLTPRGPESNYSTDVWAQKGMLWIAHGGANALFGPTGNMSSVSSYQDGVWTSFRERFESLDNVSDAMVLLRDNLTKKMLVGHTGSGLSEIDVDGNVTNQKAPNIEPVNGDPGTFKVMGLAQDAKGNVWLTNYWSDNELKVRTKDGAWYKFHAPTNTTRMASKLVIDQYDTKWYLAPNGNGIVGYNDNGTLENDGDDLSRTLRMGKGSGNLPSNQTRSIAVDKDGSVWIGTSNGIGIIDRPYEALKGNAEADIKWVKFEGFNFSAPLFEGNEVTAIAVDGANRKWIGTASSGAFLISENLKKQVYRFTKDNSPLPSDAILDINIDPVTGDVYFSTDKGLAMYRSTASEPLPEFADPLTIYPNPVPSRYEGAITISGFKERSDVRITDVVGQLVLQGTSNGGAFVWYGKDYTGRKVQSGVYIVFAIDQQGKESEVGKLIINE